MQKGADVGGAGGNQRGRGELGKVENGEFFVEIAHCLPAVEHFGAVAFGQRQKLGGVKVLHVERRVGAHNHGAKGGQRGFDGGGSLKPVVVVIVAGADKFKLGRLRHHLPVFHRQRTAQGVEQAVAAAGGFAHHGVGGVFIGFETGHRVGDKQDVHNRLSGR